MLPVPGANNFRYSRVFRLPGQDKPKLAARKPATTANASGPFSIQLRPNDPAQTSNAAGAPSGPRPPRAVGHQFSVVRPLPLWGFR